MKELKQLSKVVFGRDHAFGEYVVQATVSPDEVIRVELVVVKGGGEQVGLGEHDHIVVLECILGVILPRKGRILLKFLPYPLHVRVEPEFFKSLDLFEDEDCVVGLAALPDIGLDVLPAEDDEVGVGLQ